LLIFKVRLIFFPPVDCYHKNPTFSPFTVSNALMAKGVFLGASFYGFGMSFPGIYLLST
jgi:hypothetical protein